MMKKRLICSILLSLLILTSCGRENVRYNQNCTCTYHEQNPSWRLIDEMTDRGRTLQRIYFDEANNTTYVITYLYKHSAGVYVFADTKTEVYVGTQPIENEEGAVK